MTANQYKKKCICPISDDDIEYRFSSKELSVLWEKICIEQRKLCAKRYSTMYITLLPTMEKKEYIENTPIVGFRND